MPDDNCKAHRSTQTMVPHARFIRAIKLTAIGLLIVYCPVTAAVDLFHNHTDLIERDDCLACVWHQLSQEKRQEIPVAEQVVAGLSDVTLILPLPLESEFHAECDHISSCPIRAPPAS